jgi:hypothetical protein
MKFLLLDALARDREKNQAIFLDSFQKLYDRKKKCSGDYKGSFA